MSVEDIHSLDPGEGSPVLITAGVLKTPEDIKPFYDIPDPLVAPTVTIGSYTMSEWQGNKTSSNLVDSIHYPDQNMFGNALGLPNPGRWGMQKMREPIRRLSAQGIRTIISITNLPSEEGMEVIPDLAEIAAELLPTAIEVNLSCPNGKASDGSLHAPICNDATASGEILEAVRWRLGDGVLVGVKDAPHVASLDRQMDRPMVRELMKTVDPYVDFVTGINTIGNQEFPEITAASGRGGMSGPAVAGVAHEWLMVAQGSLSPDVAILSCGGVESSNLGYELNVRKAAGALLIGGAQEFYRAANPAKLAVRWAEEVL